MKLKTTILAAATCISLAAAAQQINPITQAMLDGYSEVLRENPKDYETLYQRAAQYYQLSLYDQALNDITKALDNTPQKASDMLAQEYSLLADINIELKNYEKALSAIENALAINPSGYADLYKKGNISLYLNRPEEAYEAFSALQRLKTRSQEAYFGMAKADIMMGKKEEARDLMRKAQDADPSNYITFCRLGDLKRDLGEDESAAADYLSAFSMASDPTRPLDSMVGLAFDNYAAFETAINYALSLTSNKTPLYFLKGNIALNSGNYDAAYDALGALLQTPEGKEGEVYAQMARACYALDKLGEAQTHIDIGLIKSPTAQNYITKSNIELALGNPAAAMLAARKACSADPQNVGALTSLALASAALDDGKGALDALNEAVMTDPSDSYTLMLRGWLNTDVLKNAKAGVADYSRVATSDAEGMPALAWKALAQSRSGKSLDAESTILKGLGENPTKDDYYYAAVFYARTGNMAKAREMIVKAKDKGFQNIHLLKSDNTADLNIAPIRHML